MRVLLSFAIIYFSYTFLHSNEINNCNILTEKYGKEYNLPNKLLTSIALVESGIKKTVVWYLENEEWWRRVKSGVYQGQRLGLEVKERE